MTEAASRGVARPAGEPNQAARLHGPGDVRVGEETEPVVGPGEVLVHVTAVGLCGSDRHWFEEGSIGDARLERPLALGHEFAGRLDDGSRVVADPCIPCGRCRACRSDREHLCAESRFAGHGTTDGALRSRIAWPAAHLRSVPDSIPDDEGVLLEPLGVALHAVDLGRPTPSGRVAVIGCGPIGLLIVQLLRLEGAAEVLAADPLPHRLAAARSLGAVPLGDAASDEEIDVVFEVAGTDDAVAAAIDVVAPGGRIVLVGIPDGDRTTFVASRARRKELTLQLCRRMRSADLDRAIELAAAGRVDLSGLVTHRFPLREAPEAFRTLAAQTGIKVIVQP